MSICLPPPDSADDRLEFALSLLVKRRAYVAALVIKLGQVGWTQSLTETAAVEVTDRGIRWWFNPEYFSQIDNFELAGIMVHEAFHVAFRHPQRCPNTSRAHDRHLFNLACDAVINDLIAKSFPELKLPSSAVTGIQLVGFDTSSLTAEDVLRMLRQREVDEPGNAGVLLESLSPWDDHTTWSYHHDGDAPNGAGAALAQELDQLLERYRGTDPGVFNSSSSRSVSKDTKERPDVDLRLYLRDALRLRISGADWSRPNRKLAWLYPDLLIPSDGESPDHQVLIALDTSASVSSAMLDVAMSIARQPMVGARVTLVSFDTHAYPVGEDYLQLHGGGGTNAEAVEKFALGMRGYPDTVFIITDGYMRRPRVTHPERWVWILPRDGNTDSIPTRSRQVVLANWDRGEFEPRWVPRKGRGGSAGTGRNAKARDLSQGRKET